jgi:hypothetical protein
MSSLVTKQFLSTDERISEVLFGLIMVLGFTGSLSDSGSRLQTSQTDTMQTCCFGIPGY